MGTLLEEDNIESILYSLNEMRIDQPQGLFLFLTEDVKEKRSGFFQRIKEILVRVWNYIIGIFDKIYKYISRKIRGLYADVGIADLRSLLSKLDGVILKFNKIFRIILNISTKYDSTKANSIVANLGKLKLELEDIMDVYTKEPGTVFDPKKDKVAIDSMLKQINSIANNAKLVNKMINDFDPSKSKDDGFINDFNSRISPELISFNSSLTSSVDSIKTGILFSKELFGSK